MRSVRATRYRFDIDKIRADIDRIRAFHPSLAEQNQISLRYRPITGTTDPFELFNEATGPFSQYKGDEPLHMEHFTALHPMIEDSYLGEIYRAVQAAYPSNKIGRYRIMRMEPRTCYVWHRDNAVKFHVPVVTNRKCFFLTPYGLNRMREPGRLYIAPTHNFHTAVNASPHVRTHLILCTADPKGLHMPVVYRWRRLKEKLAVKYDDWRYGEE